MQPIPRDMWEQRYGSSESYYYGTEPNEFLAAQIGHLPTGSVMCLAEGEGRNAVFLAERGFVVSSVDLSDSGILKTRRLAAARGVEVNARQADLAEFDLGERRWDAIVSVFAHVPLAVRVDLHRRVVTALRPGGVLLLEAYTPDQIGRGTGGPQVAEFTMTLAGLRAELAGLVELYGSETVRPVLEGPGHTGDGAVVQFIARRPD